MALRTPENGRQINLGVPRSPHILFNEPVYSFYLGKPLHDFLTRTAAINGPTGSAESVLGKCYIPGEPGKTGVHFLLKQPLLDTRPDSLPRLRPVHGEETRYLQLDIEGGVAETPTGIDDVVSVLNAAVQLSDAVRGAEYQAIVVSRPPRDIADWFEEQRADRTSGWRRSFEHAPIAQGRRLPTGASDTEDLTRYILWL